MRLSRISAVEAFISPRKDFNENGKHIGIINRLCVNF